MDTARDFEPFRGLMDKLCATFDRPPKDEVVEAYWNSLRDVRFAEVERNVTRVIRNATADTKWPKPGDLRDASPEQGGRRSAAMEANFRVAEERAVRNLEALRTQDSELWELETGIARCGRILASDPAESPQFAEALRLDRQYRDKRRALWTARAAAEADARVK